MAESKEVCITALTDVMDRLLGEHGCPWDKEQTHQTLKRYLLEETHEVIEAINNGDMNNLQEELGDLLLQIVFHAKLAEGKHMFTMEDVVQGIADKLIRRHPHVFGEVEVENAGEVLVNWDAIKAQEKGRQNNKSALDNIPETLPALLKAYKIQEKARKAGFDLHHIENPWDFLDKQKEQLKISMDNQQDEEKAIGEMLFAVVNVIRTSETDPENSLLNTISRFRQAFEMLEQQATQHNKAIDESTVEELKRMWKQVNNERS